MALSKEALFCYGYQKSSEHSGLDKKSLNTRCRMSAISDSVFYSMQS